MVSNYAPRTVKQYEKSIRRFEKWLHINDIISPLQADLDRYITESILPMKLADNSRALEYAALRFKINHCENRKLIFPKPPRNTKMVRPHTAFTIDLLQQIFKLAKDNSMISALIRLLYDSAARI